MDNYTGDNTGHLRKNRAYNMAEQTDTILVTVDSRLKDAKHQTVFKPNTRVAKDSGCFPLLLWPELADKFSVRKLLDRHLAFGVKDTDAIISADFPMPRNSSLSQEEVRRRQRISVNWYNQMREEIEQTIPVIHGRTLDDLRLHIMAYEVEGHQPVAFGSNLSESKVYMNETLGKRDKSPPKATRPSTKEIWRRNIDLISAIRGDDKRPFFMLGAGGLNAAALAALLGAKEVDANSWFVSAKLWQIFCSDHGRIISASNGEHHRRTIDGEWQQQFLRERLRDETYPLCTERTGLGVDGLTRLFSGSGSIASEARQMHNISELDRDAARLSEFEDDPDGLAAMLYRRWSFGGNGVNLSLLDYAQRTLNDATVCRGIRNYAKMPN